MMEIELELFGALRNLEQDDRVRLSVDGPLVSDLRAAAILYATAHWPELKPDFIKYCAFASSSSIVRDAQALPLDGRMAILPPVSGG